MNLLAPLDYPRQAAANLARGLGNAVTGEATSDDLLGMVPGALGVAAGLSGLGPLGMALAAGLGQGAGRLTGSRAFDAPTPGDLVSALGGDPDSVLQNVGAQLATDPLTYLGMAPLMGGAKLGGLGRAKAFNPLEVVPGSSPEAVLATKGWAAPADLPGGATHAAHWQGLLEGDAATQAAAEAAGAGRQPAMSPIAEAMGPGLSDKEELIRRYMDIYHRDMIPDAVPFGQRVGLGRDLADAGVFSSQIPEHQAFLDRLAGEAGAAHYLSPGSPGGSSLLSLPEADAIALGKASGSVADDLGAFRTLADGSPQNNLAARAFRLATPGYELQSPASVAPVIQELQAAGIPINREAILNRYLGAAQDVATTETGNYIYNALSQTPQGLTAYLQDLRGAGQLPGDLSFIKDAPGGVFGQYWDAIGNAAQEARAARPGHSPLGMMGAIPVERQQGISNLLMDEIRRMLAAGG